MLILKITIPLFFLLAAFRDALSEETIRMGAVFSLSGWGADGGQAELNGALMALEEINNSGGADGKKLELIIEDNNSDLRTTASAYRKLADVDRVAALVGPNWSEFVEVVAPLARKDNLPVVSPSGFQEGLYKEKSCLFTLWPSHTISVKPLSEYLKTRYSRVAVLLTENAYLEGIFEAAAAQTKDAKLALSPILRFNGGHNDYRSAILKLKGSKADAVLVLLVENGDLSNFLKQARELSLKLPLFTGNGIPFDHSIQQDPEIAEGVIYFDFLVPGSDEFLRRYEARFKRRPGFASAKAYDAVYLLKNAFERCGLERREVCRCLHGSAYKGESSLISFDASGVVRSIEQNTQLMQVKNGRFLPLKTE